jgi:signal transduction histidine kinase
MVAEATSTMSLVPNLKHDERDGEQLWMCGTAIPRTQSICEHTLISQNPDDFEEVGEIDDLPLSLVEDLEGDGRHCMKPYCLPGSNGARFYAAVPIRSKRGINIGVYCVIDTVPRNDWSPSKTKVMRDLSLAIMDYLELRRSKHEYRRSERMTRGLGSFVQGKSTTTGWIESRKDDAANGDEGALNSNQQSIERQASHDAVQEALHRSDSPETSLSDPNAGPGPTAPKVELPDDQQTVKDIFSKAANIIRESIEIEGALFLDASLKSFGGLNTVPNGTDGLGSGLNNTTSSPSESDETKSHELGAANVVEDPCCSVLGFSTSHSSSVDGAKDIPRHTNVPEKLLSALLRRYPRGNIFSFDENGALESGDSSGSDNDVTVSSLGTKQTPLGRGNRLPWSRNRDGASISKIFPGARSVAFVPVWNPKKDRWYAGCLAFTNTPTRIFTDEGELSYLRAFGMLTMAETFRLEATLANKAKSDVLSSLSHELRSPLHGVILGVELLHDTQLDIFQGDVLHTVETCGRTLLDTMDHLLDFAKINNYMAADKRQKRGFKKDRNISIKDGMKSLYSDIRLDVLAEEVLESIFAGFNFQQLSVAQIARRGVHADRQSYRRLDSMQAMEELGLDQPQLQPGKLQPGNVSVYLYVDPKFPWTFNVTPGAIRRIIMNLFGNALKYTRDGTIKVSMTQEVPTNKKSRDKQHMVKIVVADTGKGISEDFLQHELFKPFSQEDTLYPGTGLGLSLVKNIVSSLGGNISVQSSVGVGTTVTVILPLTPVVPSIAATAVTDEDKEYEAYVQQLKALRIRLVGFKQSTAKPAKHNHRLHDFDQYAMIESICHDWLGMQVVTSEGGAEEPTPDLVLCTEASMDTLDATNSPPTVVVCANALFAYHRATSPKRFEKPGIFEFISQP